MSPSRPAYSSYFISRSASRMRWFMTCFIVCAATRPHTSGGGVTSNSSPSGTPSSSRACAITRISPESGSMMTHAYSCEFGSRLYADSNASASAPNSVSIEIPLSTASACSASMRSGEFITTGPSLPCGTRSTRPSCPSWLSCLLFSWRPLSISRLSRRSSDRRAWALAPR